MAGDDAQDGASDREGELASLRAALQREYDAKARDLKAQHRRMVEGLEADRAAWDARRREQAKGLADQAERLRRQDANRDRAEGLKAAERKELGDVRDRVGELEAALLKAREARARLEARQAVLEAHSTSRSRLAFRFALLAVAGGLGWMAAAWRPGGALLVLAGAFTLVSAALAAWARWATSPSSP